MTTKFRILLCLIVLVIFFIQCKQNPSNEKFSFDKIYYYGIQEDVSKIVTGLNSLPDDSLSVEQGEIKAKYVARFQTKTEIFDFKQRIR